MKKTNIALFSVLGALLVLSAGLVYAHGGESDGLNNRFGMMGMMMDTDSMNEMHEVMTQNLDPELKEQMDILHEGCTSQFNTNSRFGSMMG